MPNKRPWVQIVVNGYDGRHYSAVGRLRGYVTVKGVKRIWAEGIGFDLLFDREDVIEVRPVPRQFE